LATAWKFIIIMLILTGMPASIFLISIVTPVIIIFLVATGTGVVFFLAPIWTLWMFYTKFIRTFWTPPANNDNNVPTLGLRDNYNNSNNNNDDDSARLENVSSRSAILGARSMFNSANDARDEYIPSVVPSASASNYDTSG
jgi:hypothetical protein